MADETDDRAAEREVLSDLPKARPARRSARRAPSRAPAKDGVEIPPEATKPGTEPPVPNEPAPTPAATAPEPPLPERRRAPGTDMAVAAIELTGELFQVGIDLTRSMLRHTLGRLPRR